MSTQWRTAYATPASAAATRVTYKKGLKPAPLDSDVLATSFAAFFSEDLAFFFAFVAAAGFCFAAAASAAAASLAASAFFCCSRSSAFAAACCAAFSSASFSWASARAFAFFSFSFRFFFWLAVSFSSVAFGAALASQRRNLAESSVRSVRCSPRRAPHAAVSWLSSVCP